MAIIWDKPIHDWTVQRLPRHLEFQRRSSTIIEVARRRRTDATKWAQLRFNPILLDFVRRCQA